MSVSEEVKRTILEMLGPASNSWTYTDPNEYSVRSENGMVYVYDGENTHIFELLLKEVVTP